MEGRATVNLLYDDSEQALAESLNALLKDRCGWDKVLARTESDQSYDTELWATIATDLGCAGLLIPEYAGGAGASSREAATAAEALGAAVAPVPFLGSAVVATTCLLACRGSAGAHSDQAEHLIRRMADGGLTTALAIPFVTMPGSAFPANVRVAGPQQGDHAAGWSRLRGTVTSVADALPAGMLLVPADGVPYALYAVDMSTARVTRTPVTSLDMTRQLCDITLDDAPGVKIASGGVATAAFTSALTAGAGILAAEQLGVAQHCLDLTVQYVKERRQFARPIGSFQAIKHRLADLWVAVAQARAASRYAADCLAADSSDVAVAVSLAKAYCSDVAVQAAQECVQLHGGIGFTWEHQAHLYLKRAKANSLGFGTADAHRAALAKLVNIPAP
jgi:alkylation response protein AidB-like acyl-CoA dehydrogenase